MTNFVVHRIMTPIFIYKSFMILVPKYCSFNELSNDMLTLDIVTVISEI